MAEECLQKIQQEKECCKTAGFGIVEQMEKYWVQPDE